MGLQASEIIYLQGSSAGGATANGNGTPAATDSFLAAQILEIAETGGGTCTVALQGSFDGASWIAGVGYQQTDSTASLARAVANISVTANSRHVYQVLDPYPQLRAVVSAVAGGASVTVKLYAVPS